MRRVSNRAYARQPMPAITTDPATIGGHLFDFDGNPCTRCGMTREQYTDTGAQCPGEKHEPELLGEWRQFARSDDDN